MALQKPKMLLVIILLAPFVHPTVQTLDCVLEEYPKTRIFSSLDDYQSTRISFNPHHIGYIGNVVTFNIEKLEVIPKNSFMSFNSDSIVEINLQKKQIEQIDPGAFLGLDCLNELNLSDNNLTDIAEGTFEGLDRLKNLLLNNNLLESIPDSGMTFLHLTSLKILNLSMNRIKTIERISFDALGKLEVLDLGYNRIRFLDDTVFNSLENLEVLLLNNNYLTTISAHKWENLGKLTYLNLASNYLTHFDFGHNFSFPNLTKLNLSGNVLTRLNGYELIQFFKNLQQLDIENNYWTCKNLSDFKSSLYGSKIGISSGIKCSNKDNINWPKEIVRFVNWSIPKPTPEDSQQPVTISNATFTNYIRRNIAKQIDNNIISEQRKVIIYLTVIQNLLTFLSIAIVVAFLLFVLVKLEACSVMAGSCGYRENNYDYIPQTPEMYRLIRR